MKRLYVVIIFIILAFFHGVVFAGSIDLIWDANSEPDITGYNLYYGTSSREYGASIPLGNVTGYTISGLQEGATYYFAITALDAAGNESGYSAEFKKTLSLSQASELIVSNLIVASGRQYEIIRNGVKNGAKCYIDRTYTFSSIPGFMDNGMGTYIKTANRDKKKRGDNFISFDVNKTVYIGIAHDDRIKAKPVWLSGFWKSPWSFKTNVTMSYYAKEFLPGKVTLGGNNGSSKTSMYAIFIFEKED